MVNDPDTEGDSGPATITVKRSTLLLAALAAAIAVATAVAAVIVINLGSTEDEAAQPSTDPALVGTSSAIAGPPQTLSPDAFGPPASDLFGRRVDVPKNPAGQVLPQQPGRQKKSTDPDWLTAAPAGTRDAGGWQRVYGVSVPFSTSDGPARIEEGLALGYGHTPQGAALAVLQIAYRQASRPADDRVRDRQMIISNEDKAAVAQNKTSGKVPEKLPDSTLKYLVAPDAYRVEKYSGDAATIWIANRGPTSTWLALQYEMLWVAGDWRWKPPPGFAKNPAQTVASLEGWTTW